MTIFRLRFIARLYDHHAHAKTCRCQTHRRLRRQSYGLYQGLHVIPFGHFRVAVHGRGRGRTGLPTDRDGYLYLADISSEFGVAVAGRDSRVGADPLSPEDPSRTARGVRCAYAATDGEARWPREAGPAVSQPSSTTSPWVPVAYLAGVAVLLSTATFSVVYGAVFVVAAYLLPWAGFFWAKLFFWRKVLQP